VVSLTDLRHPPVFFFFSNSRGDRRRALQEKTTFVCVCISEFLSLYETERLVQELTTYEIDTHNIVVNQLLFPNPESNCEHCRVRHSMQQKYLREAHELYDEFFHIIQLPLLTEEVRGPQKLREFSEMLVEPYKPVAVV